MRVGDGKFPDFGAGRGAAVRRRKSGSLGVWECGSDGDRAPTPLPYSHTPALPYSSRKRSGFTLIEVLAAMLLIAIVLPAAMKGVANVAGTANNTRHRSEAAGLAEAKLNELTITN